jgi:hypothetical protein
MLSSVEYVGNLLADLEAKAVERSHPAWLFTAWS